MSSSSGDLEVRRRRPPDSQVSSSDAKDDAPRDADSGALSSSHGPHAARDRGAARGGRGDSGTGVGRAPAKRSKKGKEDADAESASSNSGDAPGRALHAGDSMKLGGKGDQNQDFSIVLGWSQNNARDLSDCLCSCVLFAEDGNVLAVFSTFQENSDEERPSSRERSLAIDLSKVKPVVHAAVFSLTLENRKQTMHDFDDLYCRIEDNRNLFTLGHFHTSVSTRKATSCVLLTMMRDKKAWKAAAEGNGLGGRTVDELLPQLTGFFIDKYCPRETTSPSGSQRRRLADDFVPTVAVDVDELSMSLSVARRRKGGRRNARPVGQLYHFSTTTAEAQTLRVGDLFTMPENVKVLFGLGWKAPNGCFCCSSVTVGASVLMFDRSGEKVGVMFLGRKEDNPTRGLLYTGTQVHFRRDEDVDQEQIYLEPGKLPEEIHSLVFIVHAFLGGSLSLVKDVWLRITDPRREAEVARFAPFEMDDGHALVMGRVVRGRSEWAFSPIGVFPRCAFNPDVSAEQLTKEISDRFVK